MKKVIVVFLILLSGFVFLNFFYKDSLQKEEIILYLIKDPKALVRKTKINKILNKTFASITNVSLDDVNTILMSNIYSYKTSTPVVKEIPKEEESDLPKVYIYNTHQKEAYSKENIESYSIAPTVLMASYMLSEQLKNYNISSLVETKDVNKVVKDNSWEYYKSYDVTRGFMKEVKEKYPTIDYYIDLHRDALSKDLSTTVINGKAYAKIMFVIGMKNPNYNKNLQLLSSLNKLLEENYPTISRGIFKRNYIYNQDLSSNAILVELGGEYNRIEEIYNSVVALSCVLNIHMGGSCE